MSALRADEYQAIQKFLESRAGISLGTGKEYLVSSRLNRLLPLFKLASFAELVEALQRHNIGVQTAVVDAMTTNETFWFRDQAHYHALVDGILVPAKPTRLRIWSAAASTGQEAYTLGICLQDALAQGRLSRALNYDILGTDISATTLKQAREARYCGVAAGRGLSDEQRRRYFRSEDDCIEVLPQYRRGIGFREFNLMSSFDGLGRFDVVFCRNVLIYFTQQRKRDIIQRIARVLQPGGHLFLGSTESMSGNEDLFEMHSHAGALFYRRR